MPGYNCILADPPWEQPLTGSFTKRAGVRGHGTRTRLDYPTLTVQELCRLNVSTFANDGCHLWLWTTNRSLRDGFKVMESWGFTFLAPITWCKPSGVGAWFVHTTQTLLFGYKDHCTFPLARFKPTHFNAATPRRHSEKPGESYRLVESVSLSPRLELFCRPFTPLFPRRPGWDVFGDEVESQIKLEPMGD